MKWIKYPAILLAALVLMGVMENWSTFEKNVTVALIFTIYATYKAYKELESTKERLYKLEALVKGFPE